MAGHGWNCSPNKKGMKHSGAVCQRCGCPKERGTICPLCSIIISKPKQVWKSKENGFANLKFS